MVPREPQNTFLAHSGSRLPASCMLCENEYIFIFIIKRLHYMRAVHDGPEWKQGGENTSQQTLGDSRDMELLHLVFEILIRPHYNRGVRLEGSVGYKCLDLDTWDRHRIDGQPLRMLGNLFRSYCWKFHVKKKIVVEFEMFLHRTFCFHAANTNISVLKSSKFSTSNPFPFPRQYKWKRANVSFTVEMTKHFGIASSVIVNDNVIYWNCLLDARVLTTSMRSAFNASRSHPTDYS